MSYITLALLHRHVSQAGPHFRPSLFDFSPLRRRISRRLSTRNPEFHVRATSLSRTCPPTSKSPLERKQIPSSRWATFVLASSAAACQSGSVSSAWPSSVSQEVCCSVSEGTSTSTSTVRPLPLYPRPPADIDRRSAVAGDLDLNGNEKAAIWIMSLAFTWFALISLIG